MGDVRIRKAQVHRGSADICRSWWFGNVSDRFKTEGDTRMNSKMDFWGNSEVARKGAMVRNATREPKDIEERPKWLDMIPIKRYETYTRFLKQSAKGNSYYVCYPNSEIDQYKKEHGID